MSLQKRIKKYRLQNNYTQDEISRKVGMKRANYSHMEQGRQLPTISQVIRMCRLFDISADLLLTGKEFTRKKI